MDAKVVDFKNISILPSQIQRNTNREKPVIQPIEKAQKGNIWQDIKGREGALSPKILAELSPSEEDAKMAAEIMSEHLQDTPQLESNWKYDKDHNMLVIEIKDKLTGRVLRQIPPEEILSGNFIPDVDANGNIINKVA